MFPPEEVCFLLGKYVFSWGSKDLSSWGSIFPHEVHKKIICAARKFIIPQYFFCFLIALWFLLLSGSFYEEYIPLPYWHYPDLKVKTHRDGVKMRLQFWGCPFFTYKGVKMRLQFRVHPFLTHLGVLAFGNHYRPVVPSLQLGHILY